MDLFNYHRRKTLEVKVGNIPLGANNPIRLQSMVTASTDDINESVNQTIKIIQAGGEYVRFTTQGTLQVENLEKIKKELLSLGYNVPLIADVHFNADVADKASSVAQKVRINPGNYVDPARKFLKLEYKDREYKEELEKLEKRFSSFLSKCKQNHVAIRIGVNHGSLSDRIMSRYGDTKEGIVESLMEFLRICQKENFPDVVISIKASNTSIMVESVRLLVSKMDSLGMSYPLHLGVTEAGEGEDGRIKSAVGIGALLLDGIGDTIRVSLSESPEKEIPVAKHIVDYIRLRENHPFILGKKAKNFSWLEPKRRSTLAVENIGGKNPPIVISTLKEDSTILKENISKDIFPDYIYVEKELPKNRIENQRYIVDYNIFHSLEDTNNVFPLFSSNDISFINCDKSLLKFLIISLEDNIDESLACLKWHPEVVAIVKSEHINKLGCQRLVANMMMDKDIKNPIVFHQTYKHSKNEKQEFQLEAAIDLSALMFDGLTDGIWLENSGTLTFLDISSTAFAILQAARLRISKTEYISCPQCGRTLYDLQSVIAKVKEATKDFKGLKIAIMGCIVNGPGEMADADYGYVGAARGKISLYKGKQCVEKNIPQEQAIEKLLKLIESDRN